MISELIPLIMWVSIGTEPPPLITPVAQSRYVLANTTNDFLRVDAPDYGPFDEYIHLDEEQWTTYVEVEGEQESEFEDLILKANGNSEVYAITEIGDIVIGEGQSRIDYDFIAEGDIHVTIMASLSATGVLNFPAAAVRVTDSSQTYLLDEMVYPGEERLIIEVLPLEPGQYTLQVVARSIIIFGFLPAEGTADAHFSMFVSFDENCIMDLNRDDLVNIDDTFELLSYWGENPHGPPDFNLDGTVNIDDLFLINSFWGDCPDDLGP